jgi:hypothetical protein
VGFPSLFSWGDAPKSGSDKVPRIQIESFAPAFTDQAGSFMRFGQWHAFCTIASTRFGASPKITRASKSTGFLVQGPIIAKCKS